MIAIVKLYQDHSIFVIFFEKLGILSAGSSIFFFYFGQENKGNLVALDAKTFYYRSYLANCKALKDRNFAFDTSFIVKFNSSRGEFERSLN